MDSLNSRVFIINGNLINSISNLSGDILQNALQDVDNSPSDSAQSQVDSNQFIQHLQNSGQANCVDELVTYSQGNEDEPTAIHLTAEQAVALGLELDDMPSNAPFSTGDKVISTNKDQFVFSKDPSNSICLFSAGTADTSNVTTATFEPTEQNVTSPSDDINKLKLDSNIIEQLNETINPQLRVIPQIHNGTITSYTLQVVSNAESNELSTNNFNLSSAKDSVHMLPVEKSVANSTFDLSSLTTPTLVQSTLAMSSVPDSNNSLTENGDILNTETENTINENLVVYENESLPQMIESHLLSNKYQRFVRLNPKTILNSNTKSQTALYMTAPPPLQPISSSSSVTTSQAVESKNAESFSLNTDQVKVQTLNLPQNGSKLVPIKPAIQVSKEKVVVSLQTALAADSNSSGNDNKVGTTNNPIRVIQQNEQTFKVDQPLSKKQLCTVESVLAASNKHIARLAAAAADCAADDRNNTTYHYDKNTNTRIYVKILSPEDLQLKKAAAAGAINSKKRGRPSKAPKAAEGGEATQAPEEPPRKKVPLPRTRSGRLSRPPRHIVRDYKRIRRLDDDIEQDGSFSDYQTDDQDDTSTDPPVDNQLLPGLAETKKRRISSSFRCPNCNKVYLGIHKMENHFFKYPDHRPPPPPPDQQPVTATAQSNSGVTGLDKPGIQQRVGGGAGSFPKRRFKRHKVKPEHVRDQLKQLLNLCTETELVEVVGPVLASVLSAWELLLLRVDAVTSSSPSSAVEGEGGKRTQALCDEIKSLLTSFTQVSAALFQPLDSTDPCVLDAATFEMKDMSVSSVLGVPCGVYRVDEDSLKVDKILTQRKSDTDSGVGGLSDTAVTHPVADTASVTAEAVLQEGAAVNREKSVPPFLLGGENVEELDSNLDRFVQNFTSDSRDLSKSEVDELVFNALERGGVGRRADLDLSLTEPFLAIGGEGRRPAHVSASTEDLIKSLENFVSADDLPSDDRTGFETGADNFNRVDGVDALDFDVLSQNFHSGGANS
ncbi:hypothetical protein LSTR_LSTR006016 [Laodelphax striatellus]|uniref:DUF4764 domain-containing protein n=1 Tax=Laodelphax striatellus TaxID=195883 RepID=A0A482XPF6_LAOST|nr:hypothetical protein LSTR_LSTR006016 [Laodelphax striatellus]